MKRLLTTLAAATLVASAFHGPATADEALRVGVEGAYPPFSWKEADGSLKGFDIDIAHAICEKLGRDCTLVEQDWDGMIPALLARKFDAIIASMSITEERKKRVDFTAKYYNTPAMFVAPEGSAIEVSPAGLAGKAVGVQRGTTHQCFMEKIFPDADLRLYASQEEVFLDLAAGRLDAQFSDSLQADEGFLKTDAGKGYAFVGGPQHDPGCHGEGAGIAVRKGEEELLAAITAIREDGTYRSINDRYFEFDVYGD